VLAVLGGAAQDLGKLEQSFFTLAEQLLVLLEVARQNTSDHCLAANSTVVRLKTLPLRQTAVSWGRGPS